MAGGGREENLSWEVFRRVVSYIVQRNHKYVLHIASLRARVGHNYLTEGGKDPPFILRSSCFQDQINWHAHEPQRQDFWTCTGVKQISQASCFSHQHAFGKPSGTKLRQFSLMAEKPPQSPSSATKTVVPPQTKIPKPTGTNEAENAQQQFMNSFTETRQGRVVQKYKLKLVADVPGTGPSKDGEVQKTQVSTDDSGSKGTTDGLGDKGDGLQDGLVEDLGEDSNREQLQFNNFQDWIDYTVQHALINQSGVLVNTLTNMVKFLVDGTIAKHQATGPVYLPGGVFPNYRYLITGNQQPATNITPVQPTAPVSAPAPAAPSSAPRQTTNPRLLTREQPQHVGQNINRLTQEQVAAMFLPNPLVANPAQSMPIQQTPPRQQTDQSVLPQVIPEHLVHNIQPNFQNYYGGNLSYQYQPPLPHVQYQQRGSPQPQFAPQFNQFEPIPQQMQGVPQQRPWADMIADVMRKQFGLKPKDYGNLYQHPYPEWFERLADLAFQGLIAPIKEKFSSQEFESLSHLAQKVTLHEQRFAEAKKNFKKINHVYPYMYDFDEENDSEVAAAEWVRSKKVVPCQWVRSSGKEERIDFDITKADKIFDLLLREKQIQLPDGHIIPSTEELGERRYCKWHNSGSHSTNDCKVFRQQIQVAIEGGKIKFDDSKKPMKVDGNPFSVNMERYYEEDDGGFDPHWDCEFFRFCWNEGMRLPSIENCPGCSDTAGSSSRSCNRGNRLIQKRIPVHQRLGHVNQDYHHDEDEDRKTQWCPTGIFTKNQKRMVQRIRNMERFQEVEQEINHRLRKTKTKQAIFEKPEGTKNRHLKPLYINRFVNGKPMSKMMVDGGAAVNLMPYATFRKLGRSADDLIKMNMVLKDFGGNPSETKGVLNVELTVGNKIVPTTFFVIDGKGSYSLLLGRDWIHANCCIPSTMHQCLIKWQGDKIEIVLADSQLKMESPNYYFEGVVEGSNVYTKDTVDDLDDKQGKGFMSADDLEEIDIGLGDRPRPTFIIPVIKKNGKVRVCIDFQDLNKATPKDEYPMPVADQLVDAASGYKILSFMNGNAGYNQIFMAEEDIHKTAFRCPGAIGLFEWVVMTFGLKSTGATYQRAMNYIFHDLIGWLVEVYIDDVVVKSKEVENHIVDLRKVFERTRKYGLKMNPTKCAFGVSVGQFLGFLVHERGIEVTQRSINAIKKIHPPEDKKKLQELIGKINFVRRFISNLSGRLEPFTPLLRLKADQEFTWGAEQQRALDNIKEYLSSPPVLIPPQKGIPFRLYLSAGEKSIGSVLIQELEGKERAVFYLSRRLLDAETRHYLLSNECTVICKADVVKYMLSAPILKGRVRKWIFALTEFDLRYESPKAIKGIGLVIISPRGASFEFAYTIKPYATNNQAEYQAVLKGLQLLKEVEADAIEIMGDSLLVISQLAREYECKNDTLMVYNEKCRELMDGFWLVTLKHVSREQNVEANDLAQGASGYKPMMRDIKIEVATISADDWRYDVYQYLQNSSQSASQKLRYKALKYTLLDDELYYRTIDGVLLKCLSTDKAKVAIGEVHEGICGTHQSAHKMKWLLRHAGYFWPTIFEDCFRYYKGCQDCQKFGAIQRAPASAMNPIIKPWPFRGWGMDMIGQINPSSSKRHKFILVATDYFTKWVEAIPLKKVDSGDAIQFVQEHIIYRFGILQTITTDQGSIFVSDEFVQFADSMGIKLLNSSPYYVQANG
uniref:Retrotransposon protein, putative, unclassified n=1 Tax=Oryza sativa subsp. japonica TaxID=39947 RepID=Q2R2G1_ORYSJ|nr:retrotransposon protein, putative, unclassified [Oryza sativa Japonica Group]